MNKPLLSARNLHKVFKSPGGKQTVAIDQVDLDLYTGEVVALIGESGSGKTTLGRALLRLISLDQGQVQFLDQDLLALKGSELRQARRQFQMIFQNQQANLHPRLSVAEMMDESLVLHHPEQSAAERQSMMNTLLDQVGLSNHHDRYLASLSGGEQRRVGLARILATSPKLVVADEPTSGLDAAIKLQTIELLKTLKGESLTYLLISHDLGLVRRIADRVLVMLRGRIIEEISIQDLGMIKHHPYTQKLLEASNLGKKTDIEHTQYKNASIEDVRGHSIGCHYCSLCPLLANTPELKDLCYSQRPTLTQQVACFSLSKERELV